MMMKWYLTGVVFLLTGCSEKLNDWRQTEIYTGHSTQNTSVTETGSVTVEKDTTLPAQAPVEHSRNEVTDSSYLFTSLAWSRACFRDGRLLHEIGNFPVMPVPSKVIYRDRWRNVHDTLVIRDTVYQGADQLVEKTVGVSWWDKMWSGMGKILAIVVAGYVVWRKFSKR